MNEKKENSNSLDKSDKILKKGSRCNYNNIYIFLSILLMNIFFLSFFLIFGVFLLLNPNVFQGRNIDDYYNDYCRKNKNGEYYDLVCTNKYFKYNYKKKKFIWIMTDGTAYDQLVELHHLHKFRITTSFKVVGDKFKITDELHQAIITGKRNRNYFGSNIDFDNILQQIIDSNYKLNYRGWTRPIPSIIGENNGGIKENHFFYKKFIDNGREFLNFYSFCNYTNPFPFLKLYFDSYQNSDHLKNTYYNYSEEVKHLIKRITDDNNYLENNVSKEIFFEELDNFFDENPIDLLTINISNCLEKSFEWNENEDISILYYTTELDHFNHLFGKKHYYSILNSYLTEKMIFKLMNWIDENPDYALIITTDHGGQKFYGEDLLRNHGEDIPGNEGIFYIYTKELKDNYEELNVKEKLIDIKDESALIPQILYDINIPIYSEGVPYQIVNDNILAYSALKAKEIQLISLIDGYIHKYGNKYNNLLKIRKKLNQSLSQFEYIKNNYFYNSTNNSPKLFKNVISENLEKIKQQQKRIINKIKRKNRTFENIIIFVLILVFMLIKSGIEITYLIRRIFNNYFNSIQFKENQKTLLIIAIIITIFLILLPFTIPYIFYDVNINDKLVFFVLGPLLCSIINIVLVFYLFNRKKIFNEKYKTKIYYFIFILFGIFFFTLFTHYSYCFYSIKEYYSKFGKGRISNIVIIYPMFIGEIIYEMNKYKKLFYYFGGERKIKAIYIMIIINGLFLLFVFIQDMTCNLYHSGQILLNSIANFIVFILLLINLLISNFLLFTKEEKQLNNDKKLDLSLNSSRSTFEENDKNINSKKLENAQTNINNNNIKNKKEDKINFSRTNLIQQAQKTNDYIIMNNISPLKDKNIQANKRIYCVNGLPGIKLCLVNLCFWLSDESERIYLVLLFLPFLEYFDYLADFFYSKILDLFFFPYEKNYSLSSRINLDNAIDLSGILENTNSFPKGHKGADLYIASFVFFILTHNTFIHLVHVIFLLTQRSYEYCFSMRQLQKVIFARFLKALVNYVGKYKFSFAVIGYIITRRILIKNKKINDFTIVYTIPRILLFIRINFDLIIVSSFTLVDVNNEIFIHLLMLSLIDLFMEAVDIIGLLISQIIYFIYKLSLPKFKNIILVYSSVYNKDLLNENNKSKIN